jgi:tRNA A-37 threonylcarbamoyl transferase component Bud32
MSVDSQLRAFDKIKEWLNHATARAPQIRGRATLVHFWSINSEVSKNNLSQVAELRDERKREGLRVIAVHSPHSAKEKDKQVLLGALKALNVTEPCALDNDHALRDAFFNGSEDEPAYFLFDNDGNLRSSASGDNGVETIEDELDEMLRELRSRHPFCPACELFLNEEAMFCSECGLPLTLPQSRGEHPYYKSHRSASLPTIRLVNPDPLIGYKIDGKYELLARLGEGGMSVVYRARRVHIGDEVAVKVLHSKLAKEETALARFRREASAAAMLHHPNVITIHDFGEPREGEAPAFIVMEFVKGTPLRDLLRSEGHFLVERALRLMRGICAGVGVAHRERMVHRDLKPDNVLVVAPDVDYEFEGVKVVDFGFAKLVTEAGTTSGAVIGTPYYMSPEQCLGEPLDSRSDVYSLGVMFYEILSGTRPFDASTVSGIIAKQLSEPPPPLSPTLTIPRRVSNAIMHALAKEPADRPATATDLARQLKLI